MRRCPGRMWASAPTMGVYRGAATYKKERPLQWRERSEILSFTIVSCEAFVGKQSHRYGISVQVEVFICPEGLRNAGNLQFTGNILPVYQQETLVAQPRRCKALILFLENRLGRFAAEGYGVLDNGNTGFIQHRKPVGKEYIAAITELLEMCANHIWLNSIISVHNEGLAYSIDYYIQQNLRQDLQLDSLCRVFSISRGTLYNISKKNFGCGITEYVSLCRLNAAKKLLARPDMRISEVAESVGYPDANYFTRSFKKATGMTPREYKDSVR